MTVLPGEYFVPESAAELHEMMLSDHRLEMIKYGGSPSVVPGTDDWRFYRAVANAQFIQYGNLALVRPALTPLDATGDDLEAWRLALGLPVVEPSGSRGKVTVTVTGTATIPGGRELTLPNGRRLRVVRTYVGVINGSDVDVEAIDTGDATNAEARTVVRFVATVTNVAVEARVSINGPLTGGTEAETEARKRDRIMNKLQNSPGGGNWGRLREIAFNALPSVTGAWVYPALGGPASEKVVIAKSFDRARNDYSRAMATSAVNLVRDKLHQDFGSVEIVCDTVSDQTAPLAIRIKIPNSVLSGGDGRGWLDASPWPTADGNFTIVTSVTSETVIVVGFTGSAAINGQTRIAWWSPRDMQFRVFTVLGCTGTAGNYTLTLNAPLVDSTGTVVQAGEYISPAAVNTEAYGTVIIDMFERLAAGENTEDTRRVPRAARHPFAADDVPESITAYLLRGAFQPHPEVSNLDVTSLPTGTPTIPGSIDDPPKILVPSHVGIYPY